MSGGPSPAQNGKMEEATESQMMRSSPVARPFVYGVSSGATATTSGGAGAGAGAGGGAQAGGGNRPGMRCGHSLTAMTGRFIDDRGNVVERDGAAMLVLFGGATSLEAQARTLCARQLQKRHACPPSAFD